MCVALCYKRLVVGICRPFFVLGRSGILNFRPFYVMWSVLILFLQKVECKIYFKHIVCVVQIDIL